MRRILVLMLVWSGGVGAWATESKVDYMAKLNGLVTKGTDENLNAAPLYEQAFESYVECSIAVDGKDIRRWPTELPAEKRRALADWVRSNTTALDRLKQGTRRPGYWFQYQGDMAFWNTGEDDHPAETRELFWALIFRAKSRATDGDLADAVDDILTSYRFAADMRQRLFFHEQMAANCLSQSSPGGDVSDPRKNRH